MNKQELIKEYESIVKDDSLELCGCYNMADKNFMRKIYKSVLEDLEQLDEPQPIKLKDVIARIKKLDLGTQEVWLNEILNELGSDYGSLKYRAGYGQGRFDGVMEREKVTVPQFVADWYEANKDDFEGNLFRCIDRMPDLFSGEELSDFEEWIVDGHTKPFQTLVNMHQFGYEVEQEKRYIVKVKGVEESHKYLNHRISLDSWFFSGESEPLDFSVKHTRKELEEAGFEEVFNIPLFEVKEVEE